MENILILNGFKLDTKNLILLRRYAQLFFEDHIPVHRKKHPTFDRFVNSIDHFKNIDFKSSLIYQIKDELNLIESRAYRPGAGEFLFPNTVNQLDGITASIATRKEDQENKYDCVINDWKNNRAVTIQIYSGNSENYRKNKIANEKPYQEKRVNHQSTYIQVDFDGWFEHRDERAYNWIGPDGKILETVYFKTPYGDDLGTALELKNKILIPAMENTVAGKFTFNS